MAGGAGFMLDMNSKINEVRALLKREKYQDRFQKIMIAKHGLEINKTDISSEDLLIIHNKVMKERKTDFIKRIVILAFSIMFTALLVVGLYWVL